MPYPPTSCPTLAEVTTADAHLLVAELAAGAQQVDRRSRQGLRHEASPILVLAIWAVMGGARSCAAIADAAQEAAADLIDVIGLRHHRWGLPHRSTIRRVLVAAGAPALEAALRRWATRPTPAHAHAHAHAHARTRALRRRPGRATEMAWTTNAFAMDGKVATGSAHPESAEESAEQPAEQSGEQAV